MAAPTGEGKTTSLYSIIDNLNKPEINITTIEDPVEIRIKGLNQIEIDPKTNFISSLRTVLRQDPDIILVGEIRDRETAEIAMQAGQTGHYVLSTIHTIDAVEVITRLRKIGISNYDISSTLATTVSQRLVRKLCPHCKSERKFSDTEIQILKNISEKYHIDFDFKEGITYDAVGCDKCNQIGYYDRIGVFEILVLNDRMKELITQDASTLKLKEAALEDGIYKPMVIDAINKVIDRNYYIGRNQQKTSDLLNNRRKKQMIQMDDILKKAIQVDASDIHLICGLKPMLRIIRSLTPIEECAVLTEEDMLEIYDYFIRGNIDKDTTFKKTKKLDTSYEFEDIRLRVNISLSNDIPIFTLRLIKGELPKYEDLGVPDIVRRMTHQPQGLILVTGKTNSGKTTTLNALVNEINETENKKILSLENPIEYKHTSKKSVIVQKEVGAGKDLLSFSDGVKNSLREDCDIVIIGEIRDRETMEAAIETAESGHLVIGTLHTKSCAETIDRMINFYEVRDQATIKYLLSSLLKLVVSQRLLKGTDGKLVLVPEVMIVDNIVAGIIRKEKISVSEIEDAIQSNLEKGSIGLINSIAKLFVEEKITLEQAKAQIEEKNIEVLNRTIMQMRIKKDKGNTY